MSRRSLWQPFLHCSGAALLVAIPAVLQLWLLKPIGLHHPFLVYFFPITLAALYLRLEGGVTATVLSALLIDFLWLEPGRIFTLGDLSAKVDMGIFLLEGGIICYAAERLRRSKVAEAEAAILLERQQAAEKVMESEERLRLALEGGRTGLWYWDLITGVAEWNDQEYRLLGLPTGGGREPAQVFFERVHPDDLQRLKKALDEVMEQGSDFRHEFRIVRPDGEVRWLAARAHLVRDPHGRPLRMRGVNYDITLTKVMEEDLAHREAEARARADELAVLMDTVPAITFIAHDTECRRMSGSRKSRELLRVADGMSVSVSAPEGERPTTFRCLKDGRELTPEELPLQMAARGAQVRDFEMTLLFDDGTACDVFGDAVPLYDEAGGVRGAIGAFVDITGRKRLQRLLQKARDELEKTVQERTAELREALASLKKEMGERMQTVEELRVRDQLLIQQSRFAAMGEMINNIAHQWRQPLNIVNLIVQEIPLMYQSGGLTEEYLQEQVDKATELIHHMSQTIEDFRNFFRPSMEKHQFAVKELLAKTLALVSDTLKHTEIEIQVEEVGNPSVYGYLSECSQVLLNLVLNARDAFLERRGGGARIIRIKAAARGEKTVITVADNAGGIPEDIIGRVFDPYFTTKGPEKGTGIGLFMAKHIVEGHMDGVFTVRNSGGGAEFTIEVASGRPSSPPGSAID